MRTLRQSRHPRSLLRHDVIYKASSISIINDKVQFNSIVSCHIMIPLKGKESGSLALGLVLDNIPRDFFRLQIQSVHIE